MQAGFLLGYSSWLKLVLSLPGFKFTHKLMPGTCKLKSGLLSWVKILR